MAIKRATLANLTRFAADIESIYQKKSDVVTYSLKKLSTATSGMFASYQLQNADGTAVGDTIDIPKDFLVKSGTLEYCEQDDVPVAGLKVGDPYIDMVVNAKDATATDEHIYIPVKGLVDVYTPGNGISISGNQVAIKIDTTNANGLTVGTDGLAMSVVSASGNGAMTPAMLASLNSALQSFGTDGSGNAVTGIVADSEDPTKFILKKETTFLVESDFEGYTDAEIDAIFGIVAGE